MKDAYYFPHFSNARNDRRIKRLDKEFGHEGYSVFFRMLEVLRDQTDFTYPLADIDLLADECSTSTEVLEKIIQTSGLFNISDDGMVSSGNLVRYLEPYMARREKARIAALKRWENAEAKPEQSSSNASKRSKVKEVKEVKEISKEQYPHFSSEEFATAWDEYLKMRVSIKKKATFKAQELALMKLHKHNVSTATAMLEQSIFNSWQGIFELKGDYKHGGTGKAGRYGLSYQNQRQKYEPDVEIET